MLWLVDTSAWVRRDQLTVAAEMKRLLERGDELAFSPPVLLELLRGAQGDAVAAEKQALLSVMAIPPMNDETTEIASQIMVSMAKHSPVAHRVPVTDLLTAALAHQLGAGILHADHDYEQIAKNGAIDLPTHRCQAKDAGAVNGKAARQRELKKEVAQLLHQLSADRSEEVLERIVVELKRELAGA